MGPPATVLLGCVLKTRWSALGVVRSSNISTLKKARRLSGKRDGGRRFLIVRGLYCNHRSQWGSRGTEQFLGTCKGEIARLCAGSGWALSGLLCNYSINPKVQQNVDQAPNP